MNEPPSKPRKGPSTPVPDAGRAAVERPRPFITEEVALAGAAGRRARLRYLAAEVKLRLARVSLLLLTALAGGAGALWLFGAIADEVMEQETQAVDDAVFHFLRQSASPTLDELARLISAMGSEVVAVLLVLLLLYFGWRRRWGVAGSLVLTTGGAQLLNNVLKDHFQRARPSSVSGWLPAQAWSFPSGHAMVSAAFYLLLAYLGWRVLRGIAQVLWTATLVTLIVLIGLSRLYLGAHYLTDVVAGYAAGAVWTEAVVLAGQYLGGWRRPLPGLPGGGAAP